MLLAGPILRRVNAMAVNVWIALDENLETDLILKDESGDISGTSSVLNSTIAKDSSKPADGNPKLVISLITFVPLVALQPGKVYSYNLIKKDKTSILTQLLTNDTPLGYEKNALPSFVLPSAALKDLVVAHGSCRKMHGEGPEALSILDKQLQDNLKNPVKRIQQLFLTGDQIYADEIPRFALWAITKKAQELINGKEDLPLPKLTVDGVERGAIRINPADAVPGLRSPLLNDYAKMTTGEGAAHLMTFGEYCVAHLYAWSPDVWEQDLKDAANNFDTKIKENWEAFVAKTGFTVDNYKAREYLHPIPKDDFDKKVAEFSAETFAANQQYFVATELQQVKDFLKRLPLVRRVLANTPTYMIFDDHDVTDDWNISMRWKNEVYLNSLGRSVVRNSLMAYTLFQDLGNVPDEYRKKDSKRAALLSEIIKYADTNDFSAFSTDNIDQLLGTGKPDAQPQVLWHYLVESGDKVRTLFLDTRNRRGLSSLNSRPELLDTNAFKDQFTFSPAPKADETLFVISACPAIGLSVFEEMIYPLATSVKGLTSGDRSFTSGQLMFDNEAWYLSSKAFEQLLSQLAAFKQAVVFSGDFHYGFTTLVDYWKKEETAAASRMIQLVSSPLKNLWKKNIRLFQSGFVQGVFSGFGGKVEKFGWATPPTVTGVDLSLVNHRRLKDTPSVIDNFGLQSTVKITPNADWRYRLAAAFDERTDDTIENLAPELKFDVNFDHTKVEDIRKISDRFTDDFRQSRSRRLMYANHVCVLTFTETTLQHTFLYRSADDEEVILKMVHEIALAPATDEEKLRPEFPAA